MDVCRTHADPLSISARPPRKRMRVGDTAAAAAGSVNAASSSSSSSSSGTDFSSAAATIFGAAAHFDLFGNDNN